MNWLKRLFRFKKNDPPAAEPMDDVQLQSMVNTTLAKTDAVLNELEVLMNKLEDLAPEELARAEWYQGLSDLDKKVVQFCENSGLQATPENFAQIKQTIASHAINK